MLDHTAGAHRVSELIRLGKSPKQLRGAEWRRACHGIATSDDASISDPVSERISVARAVARDRAVIGGWAALWLQGNTWFGGLSGPIEPALVHCPPGVQVRTRRDLIDPSRGIVHPDELIDLGDGLLVATMARAVFDEMCRARSLRDAVAAVEMATSTTHGLPHASMAAVDRVIASHHKKRGIVRARQARDLASTRSASPWETRTRLIAQLDAGIGALAVNVPIFNAGGTLLGVADCLEPTTGLVLESDGSHHRDAHTHAEDNHREESFENAGLVVCRVSALDHRDRLATSARIIAAQRRAREPAGRPGRWTSRIGGGRGHRAAAGTDLPTP